MYNRPSLGKDRIISYYRMLKSDRAKSTKMKMSNLNKVLDEAMSLPLEQQDLNEFREGKYKAQSATEAIAELRECLEN